DEGLHLDRGRAREAARRHLAAADLTNDRFPRLTIFCKGSWIGEVEKVQTAGCEPLVMTVRADPGQDRRDVLVEARGGLQRRSNRGFGYCPGPGCIPAADGCSRRLRCACIRIRQGESAHEHRQRDTAL